MNTQSQLWIPTAVIVVGYLLGFYFNHRQLESFRNEFNAKIDALRAEMKQGFAEIRLEFHTQISDLSHRLDRVEERLNLVQRP
jgi:hypothetical protein